MPCSNKPPYHAVLGDQPRQETSVWRHRGDPRELQRSPRWGPIVRLVVHTASTAPQPSSPPPPPQPSSEPSPVLPSLHETICIYESMRLVYGLCSSMQCKICTSFQISSFLYARAGPLLCGISMLWFSFFFLLLLVNYFRHWCLE